jgi:ankyrin repeat protein
VAGACIFKFYTYIFFSFWSFSGEGIPAEVEFMMEKYKTQQHQLLRKLKLNEAEVSAIQMQQDQCEIPFAFESEEEKITYAHLMQNSIPNLCFLKFADLEHVQEKIKATLVVIVSRGHEKRVMEGTKIVYLGAGQIISKPVVCSLLDETSQTLVKSHKVHFFGNQVTACSVFDEELPAQRINYVLKFECTCDDDEPEISQTTFYINQRISNSNNAFEDLDELVNNICTKQILNYIVVGAAGSGKTKCLEVLKKKLRANCPGFWIVKLSMRAVIKQLKGLNSYDAFEVFESALGLDNLKAMLLKSMEERGNCILLLDDLDHVEASQQRFVKKLLKMRKIIVFSRPTDFSTIGDAEFFYLEPLTELQNKEFLGRHVKYSETAEILKSFQDMEDFDSGIPLNLLLASEVPLENNIADKFALVILYQSYLQQKLRACKTDARNLKSILFDCAYNYIVGEDWQTNELHEEAVQETGLVCVKDDEIYFCHRTIAEFLLAEAVWKKIKNEDGTDNIMAPEAILTNGKFKQVRYFMDLMAEEFKPTEIHISPMSSYLRSLSTPQKAKVTILEENLLILCEVLIKCGASFDFDARLRFSSEWEERFPVIWIAIKASADMSDEEYTWTELKLLFLKNRGASLETKDHRGQAAIEIATRARKQDLVDLLTKLQSSSESIVLTAKTNSALQNNKKYFNKCIGYFNSKSRNRQPLTGFTAKSNGMVWNQSHDTSENSELFDAVRSGDEEQVRRLLESGADVEATLENRVNSLHIAAQEGYLAIVKLLAAKMRKIDSIDSRSSTALMNATENGHAEVVNYLLLSRGADVTRVDKELNTLLHKAVKSQKLELVKIILLANKIPINSKNAVHETALNVAEKFELTEIIQFLKRNFAK